MGDMLTALLSVKKLTALPAPIAILSACVYTRPGLYWWQERYGHRHRQRFCRCVYARRTQSLCWHWPSRSSLVKSHVVYVSVHPLHARQKDSVWQHQRFQTLGRAVHTTARHETTPLLRSRLALSISHLPLTVLPSSCWPSQAVQNMTVPVSCRIVPINFRVFSVHWNVLILINYY
jgi:hypothetical protein